MEQRSRTTDPQRQSANGDNAKNPLGEAQASKPFSPRQICRAIKAEGRKVHIGKPAALLILLSAESLAAKATRAQDIADLEEGLRLAIGAIRGAR
jgi:hypothetical protein